MRSEKAVLITREEVSRPILSRGNHIGWITRLDLRGLGYTVASELFDVYPDPGDDVIVGSAASLAAQNPPLEIADSWRFYDGVRDVIRERRAEKEAGI